MTEIVILRHKIHGMDAQRYAEALRDRLPETDVRLARTPEEERRFVTDATVVTGSSFDRDLLDRAESVELFASTYAGYDHLPLTAFEKRGIALTTASGVHGPNIAEYVLGAWLSFARGFLTARRQQDQRVWQSFQADDFAGSRVCVVGLGAIGTSILDRLDGFDVETIGVRHSPERGGPADEIFGYDEIHEALSDVRYVAVACPLTDLTRGLFDADLFGTMHTDAVLVNVARGPVVETDTLVSELRRNHIGGAVLDVTDPEPLPPDHPLWDFENVLITPHNAGHTPSYYDRLADIVAENVERARETGSWDDLRNQIDLG